MLSLSIERQLRTLERRSNSRIQYGGGLLRLRLRRRIRFAAALSVRKELPA